MKESRKPHFSFERWGFLFSTCFSSPSPLLKNQQIKRRPKIKQISSIITRSPENKKEGN